MLLSPSFGLVTSPFRLTLPLEAALPHRSWEQTRRDALAALADGERFIVLGEPGTGKTLLLQALDRDLRAQGFSTRALRPGGTLATQAAAEILLVDEADLLEAEELEQLRHLPNPILMAALPGFCDRWPAPCRSGTLDRLGPEDVARFVRARLDSCEGARPVFAPEAILALTRQSSGLFRLVAILAGAALFMAEQRGSSEVTSGDVNEAASLRVSAFAEPEAEAPVIAPASEPDDEPDSEPERLRPWRRARAAAGWAGWAGASLAVVMAATLAAWGLDRYPMALVGKGNASPAIAEAVQPELPARPELPAIARSPAPVAGPPHPTLASVSPPPDPVRRPDPLPTAASFVSRAPELSHAPELSNAPEPQAPERPLQAGLVFTGGILNETMRQGGQLSLKMITDAEGNPVGALFHASHGLVGTGVLHGRVGPGGQVWLTGRLLMGRNPFECDLHATLEGDRLVGEATFIHVSNGASAHGRFNLSRL